MRVRFHWWHSGWAVLPVLLLAGCDQPPRAAVQPNGTTVSEVLRGRYLVAAGDCAACHTAQGGKPFAGGRPIPTPFGTIYSSNLTPDPQTGIGKWTEIDFYNAMHNGVDRNGHHLYPAFPYPWFTKVSREDVRAIKAYLDTLPPVQQAVRAPQLMWPLGWREMMAGWNTLYFHPGRYKEDPHKSVQWNRGAYLVEGLGHCGACHTPKNSLGAIKANQFLHGGAAGEHWFAPELTGDIRAGIGGWSENDIVEYLKTGSNAKSAAAGPMVDVVRDSTQYLSDSDLHAIAIFLRSQPGPKNETQTVSNDQQVLSHGHELYIDNCAGCHMMNGKGQRNVFPPLQGSAVVQAGNPDTLIHMVLTGGQKVHTAVKPTAHSMPRFDWKLNDQDIADVITYIRSAWGNKAGPVAASAVSGVRKDVTPVADKDSQAG